MNTDFRVSTTFWQHRKTIKLQRLLGCEGVCSLLRLWTWTAVNQPDGYIPMEVEDVEHVAGWSGEPGKFVATAVDIGWLDEAEGGFEVHDWQEHNGWAADSIRRSDEARFSRMFHKHRELAQTLKDMGVTAISPEEYQALKHGGIAAFNALRTTVQTTVERPLNDRSTTVNACALSPAPAPAPALSSSTLTDSFCAEPAQAPPAAPEAPPPAEPALMVFPLAKKGEEYPVTQKDVDEWREAYPGIDVMQGLRNCLQWNRDNPTRRKTKGGIRKHISGWLAREQNRGGPSDRASPKSDTPYRMTGRQRYMYELGNRLIPDEPEDNRVRDIIDITPNDHAATTQLEAAERRTGAPGRALPGSAA